MPHGTIDTEHARIARKWTSRTAKAWVWRPAAGALSQGRPGWKGRARGLNNAVNCWYDAIRTGSAERARGGGKQTFGPRGLTRADRCLSLTQVHPHSPALSAPHHPAG